MSYHFIYLSLRLSICLLVSIVLSL